jgi:hypothetical protein
VSDACYYGAAFNLQTVNRLTPLGTLTLTHSGESNIVITLGNLLGTDVDTLQTGFFWHFLTPAGAGFTLVGNDPDASVRFRHFSTISLGGVLSTAINALCTSLGWPTSNFLVQLHESNGTTPIPYYRFSYPTAFTYTFSTQAGADLFGASLTGGAAANAFLLGTPRFIWWPSGRASDQAVSVDGGEAEALDFEAESIATLVHADDGRGFMNSRTVAPLYRDWLQQNCPPNRVFREKVTTPIWTAQHLYEWCRRGVPFYVAHGGFGDANEYPVFQLRTAGSSWKPRRTSIANAVYYDVPFKCGSVGHLATLL